MNETFLILAQAADNAAGFFFGLGAVGLIIALLCSIFWLWMLFDALTNASLDTAMKLVWALVIFLLPFIGAVAYFFVGRRTGSRVTS
jgi:Phospholipase_D-nuclease N-terminal